MSKKFGIILSNPPYQASGNSSNGRKGGAGNELWDKFVEKIIPMCKDNGHIAIIHPSAWRKPEHKIFSEIKNLSLFYATF